MKEVILEEVPIVIGIPREAVNLTITADAYVDGEIKTVQAHYSMKDIQDLRSDFVRFIGDDWNALYMLSDEVRKEMEGL